jgi:ribosomal protein S26
LKTSRSAGRKGQGREAFEQGQVRGIIIVICRAATSKININISCLLITNIVGFIILRSIKLTRIANILAIFALPCMNLKLLFVCGIRCNTCIDYGVVVCYSHIPLRILASILTF